MSNLNNLSSIIDSILTGALKLTNLDPNIEESLLFRTIHANAPTVDGEWVIYTVKTGSVKNQMSVLTGGGTTRVFFRSQPPSGTYSQWQDITNEQVNLDANKITTGTLDLDRLPQIPSGSVIGLDDISARLASVENRFIVSTDAPSGIPVNGEVYIVV